MTGQGGRRLRPAPHLCPKPLKFHRLSPYREVFAIRRFPSFLE